MVHLDAEDPLNTPFEKRFEILLVEDNWSDTFFMKVAFSKCKFASNLNIVTDGEQALSFLNREERHALAPLPDLILLDLNLPRMDGRTFLRRIKSQNQFSNLKVVVLSGSRLGTDVREVTDMQINGYLVKPLDLNGFYQIAKDLENFLLNSKPLPMCVKW